MRILLASIVSGLTLTTAFGQDKPATAPGVAVTFSAGAASDTREDRFISLYVPKGTPATPFIAPGPFKAVYKGDIESPLKSEYTFIAQAIGQTKVTINGEEAINIPAGATAQTAEKTVQLKKGANAVVVEYSTDGQQDAQLRFDWAGKDFTREAIPNTVWSHKVDAEVKTGQELREGRMLFATRYCASCHDAGSLVPKDGTGMTELLSSAPDLMDAGARFHQEWMAAWIQDPRGARPGATMPHLPLSKEQAGDVAAYLASLGKPVETKLNEDKVATGGGLFGSLGCVGCHTSPDYSAEDEHHRIPLAHVKGKYQPAALVEFLKMPGMHNPFIRMPNFRLTDDEAGALAAYLIGTATKQFDAVPGDAAKGKALIASAGCANCHSGIGGIEKSTLAAPALAGLSAKTTSGCLAEKPEKAPDFGFKPEERAAVAAFVKSGFASLKQDNPSEYATRQIKYLNCRACHPMDGEQSVFHKVEEEVTALTSAAPAPEVAPEGPPIPPFAIPPLTHFGEKLQSGYMAAMIAGAQGFKPRPWLASRMPGFGGPGGGIANGLSFQHGLPLVDAPEPAPAPDMAEHGKTLLTADNGFNCVQCHAVKDTPPTAVFEAPGINLGYVSQRLRKGYFLRWMANPLRFDPDTKMPKFSEDGKTTQRTDVLEGKADRQFEAIWQYLQTLK